MFNRKAWYENLPSKDIPGLRLDGSVKIVGHDTIFFLILWIGYR